LSTAFREETLELVHPTMASPRRFAPDWLSLTPCTEQHRCPKTDSSNPPVMDRDNIGTRGARDAQVNGVQGRESAELLSCTLRVNVAKRNSVNEYAHDSTRYTDFDIYTSRSLCPKQPLLVIENVEILLLFPLLPLRHRRKIVV
jgi:hypothetical protein